MITLKAQYLTKEAFAPFGDVIDPDGTPAIEINRGTALRYHDLARVRIDDADGAAAISIFKCEPLALPIQLWELERHPLGSQAFHPLDGKPYLVVVTLDPAGTDGRDIPQAFIASGGQGINYRVGTWHHPLIALERESRFLVVDRVGPGHNLETVDISDRGYGLSALPLR